MSLPAHFSELAVSSLDVAPALAWGPQPSSKVAAA
jgi:hypothetical protein